ncbi:MAG TPA: cysteine dioxygenase family protein [Microlunatus sp.]|nr:cysteine dioxygenase family protein [Microlunatus sp.]
MPGKSRTPVNPATLALRLSANRSLWQGLVRFDSTSRYYARLAAEPGWEAWLLTWLPGQGTEWHDHGGSAGAFVVLGGVLTERRASISVSGPPQILPGAQQYASEAVRPFGARHLHQVSNDGLTPAVSLHVYSPGLREMNYYNPQNDGLWLADSRLAGVNW